MDNKPKQGKGWCSDEERKRFQERYMQLAHAMQTGVAFKIPLEGPEGETSPKHLRLGINMAMVDTSGVAKLLIEKGVITEPEYFQSLLDVLEEEVLRYQKWLKEHYGGTNVTLR